MAGAPSQIELFDPKPALTKHDGQDIPEEFVKGERFAFIKGTPKLLASPFQFKQHGQSGAEISELLPHLAKVADDIAIVRSMQTTQFNHAPAQIFMNTGHQVSAGPASARGSATGSAARTATCPASSCCSRARTTPTAASRAGAAASCRRLTRASSSDRAASRSCSSRTRRASTPTCAAGRSPPINELNRLQRSTSGDPEIATRIAAYEMAYRMQTSVPELTDVSKEPAVDSRDVRHRAGKASFANNCLLARRLVERGVRFVQLYHRGWDTTAPRSARTSSRSCRTCAAQTDRPVTALLTDLKQRGLLDDTLVVWGGEFGRTPMNEARERLESSAATTIRARSRCGWPAAASSPASPSASTDELGYNVVEDPVHVHDLHATILHLLGIDHEKLTYRFQGRDFRLTDVHGKVVTKLLA